MIYYKNETKFSATADELIQLANDGIVDAETIVESNGQQVPAGQMKALASIFAKKEVEDDAKAKMAKKLASPINDSVSLLRTWLFAALFIGLIAAAIISFTAGPQFGVPAFAYVFFTSAIPIVLSSIIRQAANAYGKAESEKISLLKSIVNDLKKR